MTYLLQLKKCTAMKHFLFFLLAFFPLFLFSQEKGIGLNFNIEPKYSISKISDTTYNYQKNGISFSPILYVYKIKDKRNRMHEIGLHIKEFHNGFEKGYRLANTIPALLGRGNLKLENDKYLSQVRDFEGNSTRFSGSLNYLYFLPIKKYDKLEFWAGIQSSFIFDYRNFLPTTSLALPTKNIADFFKINFVPTATYKLNEKITLDLRWLPNVAWYFGIAYTEEKSPVIPVSNQKKYLPIFNIEARIFEPRFQLGAKYTLMQKKTETKRKHK